MQLFYISKKVPTLKEAQRILEVTHPRMMANVVVTKQGLKLRSGKYHWVRNSGWEEDREAQKT